MALLVGDSTVNLLMNAKASISRSWCAILRLGLGVPPSLPCGLTIVGRHAMGVGVALPNAYPKHNKKAPL